MRLKGYQRDFIAVGILVLLWGLFFWRLLTPVSADQASLRSGDFSRQFVAFAAYQYERFADGEIPLWNPYNNGGLPFIADTQAAVFYPPRLLTIALARLSGGWTYNALQLEMMGHMLLYTLLMYIFVMRLTQGQCRSVYGALVAAIIAGYSGFMTGYPPLQLALLEAGIWLPLILLGVLEATREGIRWRWLIISGFALGISWMAGHPQTSWFLTYLVVAYLGFQVYSHQFHWRWFIIGTAIIGFITVGIAAVQLLPGLEYLTRTNRVGFGFDEKAGGFPIQDVIQFIYPNVVSVWSPLFVGVSGLFLASVGAIYSTTRSRFFWGAVAVLALGLSLGGSSAVFHALYNLLPGLSFFRGQERAAYLVTNSLAILGGLGTVALLNGMRFATLRRLSYGLAGATALSGIVTLGVFVAWLGNRAAYDAFISPIVFSTIISGALLSLLIVHAGNEGNSSRIFTLSLLGLIVFELFSINMDNPNTYEPIPASEQPIMQTPPLVAQVQQDTDGIYRVDGGIVRGDIGIYGNGNTGSLYQLQDIRGISPLFLDGPHALIQRFIMPDKIARELFAVRYVFTDAEELPEESELVGRDFPDGEILNLHRLSNPRPFAHLIYDYTLVDSDAFARALLLDPNFDMRNTVILHNDPEIELPASRDDTGVATLTAFHPERFTIAVETNQNAILSIAHVDYPGWEARMNGEIITPIRAYGALVALPIPPGEHTITFLYNPRAYRIGAVLSLFTWGGMVILAIIAGIYSMRRNYR